ncbi:MAG: hypothetical protein GX774_06275, partial [Armatimonadetes bacterium]|nr:hypothetical protein [Armatimonadota bacterium]
TAPTLTPTATTLTPVSGGVTTQFTDEVIYTDEDNDPPDSGFPKVIIDGTRAFTMLPKEPQDTDYTNGAVFTFTYNPAVHGELGVPPNLHAHTYQFHTRWTRPGDTQPTYDVYAPSRTGTYSGPTTNDPPSLTLPPEGAVSPATGTGPGDPKPGKPGATYTFKVKYADSNGDEPQSVTVTLTDPRGTVLPPVTMWLETASPAPTANEFKAGVYYIATVDTLTEPGQYTFRFDAKDSEGAAASPASGSAPFLNSAPAITLLPVNPTQGVPGTQFTFSARWADADGQKATWTADGSNAEKLMLVLYEPVNPTNNNTEFTKLPPIEMVTSDGVNFQPATAVTLSKRGVYRFYVQGDDGISTVTVPAGADADAASAQVGPTIYRVPTLTAEPVSPSEGPEGTTFTWSVLYQDEDGQPPVDQSFPRVVVRRSNGDIVAEGGNQFFTMTPTVTDPRPDQIRAGVRYTASRPLGTADDYTFEFQATDSGGDSAAAVTGTGPKVLPNTPPVLSDWSVTPTKSGPGVACTYEVTYKDADGDAPTLLQVHILGSNGQEVAVRDLLPVNPDDTAYKTGVRYRVTTTAVNGPDVYCFYLQARDKVATATFPTGVNPTDVAGTYAAYAALGPVINQAPALSDGTVSPTAGQGTTNFIFDVTYTDPDGNNPAAVSFPSRLQQAAPHGLSSPGVFLELTKPDKSVVLLPMTATGTTFDTGVVYRLQTALTDPNPMAQDGAYRYRFLAWDGIDAAVQPTTGTVAGPTVSSTNRPVLSGASVTPDPGYRNDSYAYSVTYSDLDGDAPAYLKLFIDGVEVPAADIQRQDTNPYATGTVYRYTCPAGTLAMGTHTYYWETSDDNNQVVRLPATAPATLSGPTVRNRVPSLTDAAVTPARGSAKREFVFTVTYDDDDDDAPAAPGVTLLLTNQTTGVTDTIKMQVRQDQVGRAYSDGVVFEHRAQGLTPGSYNFRVSVSDGTDSVETAVVDGPMVNHPPVLSAPTPTVTPALVDPGMAVTFRITYSDADGELPSEGLRVFVHRRPPVAPDEPVSGYTMAPESGVTPTPEEIQAGVVYTATVNGLPRGAYSHYFATSDGTDQVVYPASADTDATKRLDGPTVNSAPRLSLVPNSQGVTPIVGDIADSYTFEVIYTQREGDAPVYVHLFVDNSTTGIPMTPVGSAPYNWAAGVVHRVTLTGAALGGGQHTFRFAARDSVQECFLDQSGLTYDVRPGDAQPFPGPRVNNKATLSNVRILAAANGDFANARVLYPAQTPPAVALPGDMIRYEVTYQDADNDQPEQNQLQLYLDGSLTPVAMTEAGSATSPTRWQEGVVYAYTTPQPLAPGSHSFRIVANDGAAETELQSGANEAAPPVQTLANPRVTPAGGGKNVPYTFAVNYTSFLGSQPGHLAGVQATAKITLPDGSVITRPLSTDPQGDASSGVVFQTSETLSALGDYQFQVELNDGRFVYRSEVISQPKVAAPTLSGETVSPTEGLVGRSFEFSVLYKHEGRQPAASVRLDLFDPNGKKVQADGYAMTTAETDTALLATTGWTYRVTVPIDTVGTYSYRIEANDGPAGVGSVAVAPASGNASGPVVRAPGLTEPAVTPMTSGYAGALFTFSVKYTHGANRAPAWVRLRLTNPDGSEAEPVDLVAEPTGDYINGKTFSKAIPLQQAGQYRFYFEASEYGTTISAVSDTVEGPIVDPRGAPTLTGAQVVPAAGGGGRYTYTVVYAQSQGLAPAWVKLLIDVDEQTGQAARSETMVPANANAKDYAAGGTYTFTTPEALASGSHNFQVHAASNYDEVKTPVIAGPHVNTGPTLEVQPVSPEVGDENTTFTFAAIYKDADGQAPAYVRVSVGNETYTLTQVDAKDTNYVDGALFRAELKLPAGDLAHSFQASDGEATVRYPASGVIAGPRVHPKTTITLALTRSQVTLDGITRVGVNGSMEPAIPSAPIRITYALQVPEAGGKSREEVRTTLNVEADAQGRFSAAALPDQDGNWIVRAEYAGDAETGGTHGSGVGTVQFSVEPARVSLPASLYIVGVPMAPADGDLRNVFRKPGTNQPANFQTAAYTGKAGAPYVYGPAAPFPAMKPGDGFWLRAVEP